MVDGTGEYHRGAEHLKSIEDVCWRVTSGGTPSRRNPSYYEGGRWPWLKTQELQDGWLDDSEEHITDDAVASSSAKTLPENTVLMAMYGATVGQLGILRRPMTCNQACCAMIVDPGQADYRYLFYQLLHARPQIKSLSTGAAQQNLSGRLIRSLKFSFPSLSDQRAVAHILGTLDDKIELNRRMNETLEAMARALFKSRFVDFDPVRAKMEGRDTGLPQDIADLFPGRLVASAMGEIPEGWQVIPLDGIARFQNGLALQKFRPADNEARLPVIKIAQMRTGEANSREWARDSIRPECIIEDGDVLFSWSGSLLVKIWCGGRAALNQHLFKVTSARYPKWFFLHSLLSHLPAFRRIAQDKATTMGHIRRHHLTDALCVAPPDGVIAAVSETFSCLLQRQVSNELVSRTLVTLRDTLLPKLVSAEIRVGDAEKALETVT